MINAILFDLDDLMVNSAPLHFEASRRVFGPLGVDIDKIPDDVVATYFGKRTSEIQKLIAGYFNLKNIDIAEIIKKRDEIFLGLVEEGLEPMPGLYKLIETVRVLGIKRAVASSGLRVYINTAIKKLCLEGFFDGIVSGDMVKKGKPDPETFLRSAEILNVKPGGCVVIEDSDAGVDAAKSAGTYCIAVDNPFSRYKQNLSRADVVVGCLDEIDLEMLEGLDG